MIEVLSRVQAKGAETLIGRFPSDGAANRAVKGLTLNEARSMAVKGLTLNEARSLAVKGLTLNEARSMAVKGLTLNEARSLAVKGLTLNEARSLAVDNYTKLYVSLHLQLPRWYHPRVFFYANGVYRQGGGFLPLVSGRYPSSHHYVLAVTDEVLR